MANHFNSASGTTSSYELIGRRIQRLVSAPDVQKIQWVIVTRKDDGTYEGEEKTYKVSARIVRVEGERHGSLQSSGITAGAPSQAMVEFIRALAYDVDFQRELKEGMKFTVLLEQLVTSDGKVTHPGRLLAGELALGKRTVTVIRFRPQAGADQFYNPRG